MTQWEIQGRELINCNCAYGCPCQFNALPTKGSCEAIGAIKIDKGHHGDVTLDGLTCAIVVQWPGPTPKGGGNCQPVIDDRAPPEQRDALLALLSGPATDPTAPLFAMVATQHPTVF